MVTKPPGPDGLNISFVKANWYVIRDDFMNFMHKFYRDGSVVKHLNKTFITLIPKIFNPHCIRDFRPICLVCSLYKVLAKVLSNRLKHVMDSVISPTQIAFVKNRQLVDSFVIVEEIIYSWKNDRKCGLLVKLDFEKAYDSVDHAFLFDVVRIPIS
ncbi:hypothetical protein LWI29_024672 [Acer saccharum]|uniref:Reverse transcriptase domain-containing protein n=1 Tax=Acer saccharum TaxID=4024 RepID=A0AA39W2Q3_ACESA|nr:hypothetical protein LWI29_024672 [Acer saccharum]